MKTLNLSENITNALESLKITTPTKIQNLSINKAIDGNDLIIKSETGSGKTFCYLLPIFEKLKENTEKGAKAVIVAPTKELTMQIHSEVQNLSKLSDINLKSTVLFSNVNINKQIEKLKEKPQIIIGTSDRIHDLIKKKKIPAHLVQFFIVDEADKLIDKNNIDSIIGLRKCFMRDTQNIFVSATFSNKDIEALKQISQNVELIETNEKETVPENIEHLYFTCDKRDKIENLRKIIGIIKPEKSLIFINSLDEINVAVQKLNYHDIKCACIHSETTKFERQKAIKDFMNGDLSCLVSTDLASRGLHIDGITHVFSYTISENPSDYLHRAGRTGRQGANGTSICVSTEQEFQFIKKYQARFGISFTKFSMKNGEIIK